MLPMFVYFLCGCKMSSATTAACSVKFLNLHIFLAQELQKRLTVRKESVGTWWMTTMGVANHSLIIFEGYSTRGNSCLIP